MLPGPRFAIAAVAVALIHAASPDASAIVRRHDVSDDAYRNLANLTAFRSVGRVEFDYGFGYRAIGTATLIARDVLLSAGHVFEASVLRGVLRARINFGRFGTQQIEIQRSGVVRVHPAYNSFTLDNDVAVIFLRRPMGITPAKVHDGARVSLARPVTFVGFGVTGDGLTGESLDSTTKRAGQNALGRYVGRTFEVDFDAPGTAEFNVFGSAMPLRLEALIGAGDSGGSVWVRGRSGYRLMGINSYGVDDYPDGSGNGIESDYGDISGFVYLPPYVPWINSLARPNFGR